jgi:hypothetical protein
MKIALICNSGERMPLGKIYKGILESYKGVSASHFLLKDIQGVKGGFDYYLRVGDDDYEEVPSHLHPIGWWVNDTHLKKCYKKIKRMAKNYDFIFCAQKEGARKLSLETGRKTYWIPWAAEKISSDFEFVSEKDKVWDIVFVGTTGKYSLRKVALETIKSGYPNSFVGRADYWSLRDYYSKARIVVNYSINNDINPRIFEAMSAGALVIARKIINNGIEEIFEENKHLVIFEDIIKEMKGKIDYYLKNSGERERVARSGFEYVNAKHTYCQRIRRMMEIMGVKLA